MPPRRSRRIDLQHHDIPTKANRILNLILFAIFIIILRVWHLAVVQYDMRLEESRKPQRRTSIEPATRATIRDRFNIPLALNKIQYQAAFIYSELKDIPSFKWEKDANGKKIKKFKKREYIKDLSLLLADELQLDAEKIEDLIHAKASFYSQVPFIIKEEISEKEYYRLKMLEKDWPGICVRRLPKRYYPRGRVAADVIGYMGAINKKQYDAILHEMKELEYFISSREEGEEVELPKGIENSAQARKRLKDLQEKAYTINDYVGKTGVEGIYEEQLRGFYGKKSFYSDSRGNFLRELPGTRLPISGHRLLLSLSAELQEYAEQLLAQNEKIRLVRMSPLGAAKQTVVTLKHPWIKGGSIIVMDPHTGEVLTLATYPRFDPNDFITSRNPEIAKEKKQHINRWFENESYLAAVWDQQQSFEREQFNDKTGEFYDEQKLLSWDTYLDFVLPLESPLRKTLHQVTTIGQAVQIQNEIDTLRSFFTTTDLYAIMNLLYKGEEHSIYPMKVSAAQKQEMEKEYEIHVANILKIKKALSPYFNSLPQNYDKVLLVDFCRLAVDESRFTDALLPAVEHHALSFHRQATSALVSLMGVVKETSKDLYHAIDFKEWRQREEKSFLQQKRKQEALSKTYAKPYLDYLEQKEQEVFTLFWKNYKWDLLLTFLTGIKGEEHTFNPEVVATIHPYLDHFANLYREFKQGAHQAVDWKIPYQILQKALTGLSPQSSIQYLQTMRSYDELERPLLGRYRYLRQNRKPLEKHLAAAFYPSYGFGCGRSYAYRQATIQGSIFKIVTAYEALVQNFKKQKKSSVTEKELNPLTIIDQVYKQGETRYVGYTQEGKPIPQLYKGGRLPRSLAHQNNGEVDIIKAMGVSSNPYFSLLASEHLEDPSDLSKAARLFSYGGRTGIDLPGEIAGKVPDDLATNRTGLYAMAIGQHSLVVTPLQTAVMLSALANGGKVIKPKIVNLTAGRQPVRGEEGDIACPAHFSYQDSLAMIGLNFPLFTALSSRDQTNLVKKIQTEVKDELFMPAIVRLILLKGLRLSSLKTHTDGLASLTRLYHSHPESIQAFTELKDQIVGKTSTSESVQNIDLDFNEGANMYTHVWFGGISFKRDSEDKKKHTFLFKDEFGEPELVVIVYLHYGGYGKEAAPLAAQMIKKWRELKQKHHVL